jgi:hypothetical protein
MIIWDNEKDVWLRKKRNISFKDFAEKIEAGDILDMVINPAYDGQNIFIIRHDNYTYAVPYEIDLLNNIVLKTIYPSRKYHKMYGLQ